MLFTTLPGPRQTAGIDDAYRGHGYALDYHEYHDFFAVSWSVGEGLENQTSFQVLLLVILLLTAKQAVTICTFLGEVMGMP